jgi:hypothetical protein
VEPRAALDLLELEHDLSVVLPVEHKALFRLDLAYDGPSLVAVAPAEDADASRPRIELDLGRKPLLEPLGVCQRLPDLGGRRGKDDLAVDVHRGLLSVDAQT